MSGRGPFGFVQFEFGCLLGPADGRYVERAEAGASPRRVIVLATLGGRARRRGQRRPRPAGGGEAATVPVARTTVIDADPLSGPDAAAARLEALRRDGSARAAAVAEAAAALNRLLRVHRAASLDPYVHDVRPEQALAIRIGHGLGEQVADGRFEEALELPAAERRPRRAEMLRPQERLAAVLGGQDVLLAAEELVLRARTDVAAGRPREAALQARIALEALLAELGAAELGHLRAGLERDRGPVGRAANAALSGDPPAELCRAVADAVERMEAALRRRRLAGPEPGGKER